MFNKYTQIVNNYTLLKAASGIYRVKTAASDGYVAPPGLLDYANLKYQQGKALEFGYNGLNALQEDPATKLISNKHSWKSRGRQLAAIGLGGLGTAGGALGGLALANLLNNQLGLNDDEYEYDSKGKRKKKKKDWKKRLAQYGILGAGLVGGGLGGYMLGTTGAGFLNGLPNNAAGKYTTDFGAVLNRSKNRQAAVDYLKNYAKNNNISKKQLNNAINTSLNSLVPIATW